jgi:hypothetical protein
VVSVSTLVSFDSNSIAAITSNSVAEQRILLDYLTMSGQHVVLKTCGPLKITLMIQSMPQYLYSEVSYSASVGKSNQDVLTTRRQVLSSSGCLCVRYGPCA